MLLGHALSVCSPSGRPFGPASIASLLYDANPIAANVTLATTKVSSLADASGNANTVAQGTDGNRPIYTASNNFFRGHPSIDFVAGSTTYLFGSDLPISTALSGSDEPMTFVAVVHKPIKVTTDEEMIYSLGNSGSGTQSYLAGSYHDISNDRQIIRARLRDDAGTGESAPRENTRRLTTTAPQILIWQFDGTIATAYVIGMSENPLYDATVSALEVSADYSAQGAITFDRFALGGFHRSTVTLPGQFSLARFLAYGQALSTADRLRLVAYLWSRYIANPAGAYATSIITGTAHDWDADAIAENIGDTCATLFDSAGGKHFTQATEAERPLVIDAGNGRKALRFTAADSTSMVAGVAADWTKLHDGDPLTAMIVYRVAEGADALQPLIDTVDDDEATNNGLGVYHNGASGAHALRFLVGATNATAILDHSTQDYGATPGEWHCAIVTHESPIPTNDFNYRLWLDNEHYAEIDQGGTPAAGAPSFALTLGALAGGGTFASVDIARILIFDRKAGRPHECQWLAEIAASEHNTQHVSLVAGNGFAGVLNDAAPHRAFPGLVQDALGRWHLVYRRGVDHGASRGVGVQCDSGDLMRWSAERVIYDVDDDDGRDFRSEAAIVRLRLGDNAGRLVIQTKWSADDSNIEVSGVPSTLLIGISDDNGGSWTWSDPCVNDPIVTETSTVNPVRYTASPNGLIELQHGDNAGRILRTFTSTDKDEVGSGDQDVRISYSDDAAATWSDSVVILSHESIAWRATETHLIEFADGYLLATIRDDSNQDIYTMDSTDGGTTWGNLTLAFAGWGRPVTILDENERIHCFYRSASDSKAKWRNSDDRGVTWSAERALSNLQTTTGLDPFPTMSYCYPQESIAGDIVLAIGLEDSSAADADMFARIWRRRRPSKSIQLVNASNEYLSRSHAAVWDVSAAAGFTACGWIYRDTNGLQYFAGKYAAIGAREWAIYSGSSNFLTARLSSDGTGATVFTSTHSLAATGVWQFVALRYDPTLLGAEMLLNLDDSKQAAAHAGGIFSGAAAVRLGSSDISLTASHDGRMDRWGFWNRALTDTELAAIRNAGTGVEYRDLTAAERAGLIAFYNLGQYGGTRADSSGNAQHLTPVGMPANAVGVAG